MSNSKDNKEDKENLTISKTGKIYTKDGKHTLTTREDLFISKYIELGNGQRAVIEAGYKTKNANMYANRLLKKSYIHDEIYDRRNEIYAKNAASAQEVMDFFARVMRGEIKDQFGLEAPLSERTKAAQEIAKRTVDIDNRMAGKKDMQTPEVQIKIDWTRPDKSIQDNNLDNETSV